MKLSERGEDFAIEWIKSLLAGSKRHPVGVGDDAAIIKIGSENIVLASDMIQDKSHIYRGMSPYQAGRKVAVVNFSDLASMGAAPKAFLLSLSIPKDYEESDFKEIYRGVRDVCGEIGADFIGGDMNSGEKLILDGFAVGSIKDDEIMRRTGAKKGDIVAVTGNLGSAACGWQILERDLDITLFDGDLQRNIKEKIIKACLEPSARVKEGLALGKCGYATSCTDISDGLAYSLGYMAGDYGFEICEEKVPVHEEVGLVCERFGLDYRRIVYNIGEDFELLCTIDAKEFENAKLLVPSLVEIGRVVPGKRVKLKERGGTERTLEKRGYDHFGMA